MSRPAVQWTLDALRDRSRLTPSGCWIPLSPPPDRGGYVQVWLSSEGRRVLAHRLAYKLAHGDIPDGLEIDHLCRVRSCVNPAHLDAVTHAENLARAESAPATVNGRKTHCPQGHPYDEANVLMVGRRRSCRVCNRAKAARYRSRIRQMGAAS